MSAVAVLVAAVVWDLVLGEPPARLHPVVWVGRFVGALAGAAPRGQRAELAYGALMPVLGLVVFVLPALLLLTVLEAVFWPAYFLLGTYLLKSSFSVRGLLSAAAAVRGALAAGDLPLARERLGALVSRDTSKLDEELVAAAAIESVAENSSDSVVAPLLYFGLFGVPGAFAYRVLNTYDSMVGYHGRYEYLGKVSARLDDLANLVPARLTALTFMLGTLLAGEGVDRVWRATRLFSGKTESPNAGWPVAAMAGALDVTLEKVGHYRLGDGAAPLNATTIDRANHLVVRSLSLSLVGLLVALAVIHGR